MAQSISVIPPTGETGPLWTTAISSDAVFDNATGKLWQRTADATLRNWSTAAGYCQALFLEGMGGWRLPTAHELIGIVDYSLFQPAIDSDVFEGTGLRDFWASDVDVANASNHWYLLTADGTTSRAADTTTLAVRCVHD